MALKKSELEVGCVYQEDSEKSPQLFLYIGKTYGRYCRWLPDKKEGNTFLYIGRVSEFKNSPITKEDLIFRARMDITWVSSERFSIIKGIKKLKCKFTEVKLSNVDIDLLCNTFGNLKRL